MLYMLAKRYSRLITRLNVCNTRDLGAKDYLHNRFFIDTYTPKLLINSIQELEFC